MIWQNRFAENGWKQEFKTYTEELILESLEKLFPGISNKVLNRFSSTPLTMERYTWNSDGAIIGWSFDNEKIPAVSKITGVAKSVLTPVKNIYKCGQWSYTPAGMPVSVMTGKLAADRVTK